MPCIFIYPDRIETCLKFKQFKSVSDNKQHAFASLIYQRSSSGWKYYYLPSYKVDWMNAHALHFIRLLLSHELQCIYLTRFQQRIAYPCLMHTGFHLLKETSIGQMLARWIGNCFQLMEVPFVTEWGNLKCNPFSFEKAANGIRCFSAISEKEMTHVWF